MLLTDIADSFLVVSLYLINIKMSSTVSPQTLSFCIKVISPFIHWLRDFDDRPGSLFIKEVQMDAIVPAVDELVSLMDKQQEDVSIMQVRELGEKYGSNTWAAVIRLVVTESDPPFVHPNVCKNLIKSLHKLENVSSAMEAATIIGPLLDELPRANYYALADLCSLLRDTNESSSQIACISGPLVLCKPLTRPLPGTLAVNDPQQAAASMAIMDLLISECESVFGRVSSRSNKYSLGTRNEALKAAEDRREREQKRLQEKAAGNAKKLASPASPIKKATAKTAAKVTSPPLSPMNSNSQASASKSVQINDPNVENARRQALRTFLLWRDAPKADVVDALFDNYSFIDVAHSIHRKYGMLPPGWRQELQEIAKKGGEGMSWLNDKDAGASNEAPKNEEASPPSGLRKASNFLRRLSVRQRSSSNADAASKPNLDTIPPPPSSPPPSIGEGESVDNVINEILDSEQYYHDTLADTLRLYVSVLRETVNGKRGAPNMEALNISPDHIENIFGERLVAVVGASNLLLRKFDLISLIRVAPKNSVGRSGIVSNAFIEVGDGFNVYIPFARHHKEGLMLVQDATRKNKMSVTTKLSSRTVMQGGNDVKEEYDEFGNVKQKNYEPMNYISLWEAVSSQSPLLKGQSLPSILITPLQRVPRYKLLLQQLQKSLPPSHPSQPNVQKACDMVSQVADQINQTLASISI